MYRRFDSYIVMFSMFTLLIAAVNQHASARQPVKLIFDTDIGNDVDDVLTLE